MTYVRNPLRMYPMNTEVNLSEPGTGGLDVNDKHWVSVHHCSLNGERASITRLRQTTFILIYSRVSPFLYRVAVVGPSIPIAVVSAGTMMPSL